MGVVNFNSKSYVINEVANFGFCSKNITRFPAFSIMFQRCLLEVFGLESILDIILGLNLLGFQQMLSLSIKIQTMVEIFFLTCYKKHGRKIEKFFFKNLLFNHS